MNHSPKILGKIATTLFAVAFLIASISSTSAQQSPDAKQDGQIWGALFFGTNGEVEEATEGKAKAITDRLRKAFDETHFQLLGEHTQAIFSEYESWVVPSKDIFLKIDSKGPAKDGEGINLHLQVWREKNVLVKTDVVLRKDPIFIRGPKWGDGYLILAIELR